MARKRWQLRRSARKPFLNSYDAVLAFPTVIVEGEDFRSATGTVGNQKAQVGSGGGVLGLVADAASEREFFITDNRVLSEIACWC